MDVCGYIPHAPVRVYVMGQRGADREPASNEDLQQMARIVREGMQAGAMGVSTSRTFFHRSSDGKSTPSFEAAEEEFLVLALALKEAGKGALQLITDFDDPDQTMALLRRVVERSGRPLSVSLLEGSYGPMTLRWREVLDWAADATAAGLPIKAQVLSRAIGIMLGHELTLNTFYTCESYKELAGLPFAERIQALRNPELKARILAESADPDPTIVLGRLAREFDHMFILGDPPRLRAAFRAEYRRACKAGRPDAGRAGLRPDAGTRRPEQPLRDLVQLRVRLARFVAGDDATPGRRSWPRRRWRALRHHLRRQLSDLHAHPLGTRSQSW